LSCFIVILALTVSLDTFFPPETLDPARNSTIFAGGGPLISESGLGVLALIQWLTAPGFCGSDF